MHIIQKQLKANNQDTTCSLLGTLQILHPIIFSNLLPHISIYTPSVQQFNHFLLIRHFLDPIPRTHTILASGPLSTSWSLYSTGTQLVNRPHLPLPLCHSACKCTALLVHSSISPLQSSVHLAHAQCLLETPSIIIIFNKD